MLTRRHLLANSARIAGVAALGTLATLRVALAGTGGGKQFTAPVTTRAGKIRGLLVHGVHAFKGIPYGGSVSGPRRFLAPAPPSPWSDVKEAIDWAPHAPQSNWRGGQKQMEFYRVLTPATTQSSEDCLHLNVWTQGLSDGVKRPVMVWLHGGSFDQGSGGAVGYNGFALAKCHDVVVVTLNHRLNVLGYLYLGDFLGGEFAEGANAGQQDIVLALKWIRDNIEQFGGDPGRVMLFGQGGGAGKVCALLGMPGAKDLFHAAAMQSGGTSGMTRETANRYTEKTLTTLGIGKNNARELQKIPLDRLIAAYSYAAPVIDGKILPDNPIGSPLSENVPVIVGAAHTERTIDDVDKEKYGNVSEQDLLASTQVRVGGANAKEVIAMYRARYPKASAFALSRYMASDATLSRSAMHAIARNKLGKAPTFVYRFDWETPVMNLLAPRSLEIPFIFKHIEDCQSMTGPIDKPMHELESLISTAWVSLARLGDPNHKGMPAWPAYSADQKAVMLFNISSKVEVDPGADLRKLLIEDTLPKPMRPGA